MFAGCASTGARFTFTTVTVNDLSFVRTGEPLSLARTVTVAVPESLNPGAKFTFPVAVPVPGLVVVTVTYVCADTLLNVIAFPSGSVAFNV
jgi:hypothetical protein